MISVRFLTSYGPYNASERAGFSVDMAERLIAAGVAEPVQAPSEPAPVVEQPEVKERAHPIEVTREIKAPPVARPARPKTRKRRKTSRKEG